MAAAPDPRIASMDEQVALPRQNGELVFAAPWEARAFGLAVALNEAGVYPWRDFSQGLAAETAALEQHGVQVSYYERWLETLEKLGCVPPFTHSALKRAVLLMMPAVRCRLHMNPHGSNMHLSKTKLAG
jgi:nitrile hydratase accessory protein